MENNLTIESRTCEVSNGKFEFDACRIWVPDTHYPPLKSKHFFSIFQTKLIIYWSILPSGISTRDRPIEFQATRSNRNSQSACNEL